MKLQEGYTLFELLVAIAMLAILGGIALPVVFSAVQRNEVWTASESVGAQIRQARLKAISRNQSFRVRFDCPAAGQVRVLEVTGDATIDAAVDRCSDYQEADSGILQMPSGVSYELEGGGSVPVLTVNSRGNYSAAGLGMPVQINIGYGGYTFRSVTVSGAGQLSFESY